MIDAKIADNALLRLDVDAEGLDAMDRRLLTCMAENYGGGPVGADTLAVAVAEQRDAGSRARSERRFERERRQGRLCREEEQASLREIETARARCVH